MVKKRAIYAVRFNKVKTATDMFSTTYTVNVPFFDRSMSVPKLPIKIELIKEETRVLTSFEDSTHHEIGFTEDVELFWREVESKPKVTKK